jgi:hypothetical protein
MTALLQHLRGESAAERQARREQVLGTSVESLRAFGAALAEVAQHGTVSAAARAPGRPAELTR